MTSEERREARYQRRKALRAEKKEKYARYNDFDWVFSYEHLYQSYRKCRRNVAWKASVQKYITQAPMLVNQTYERLKKGEWKSSGFFEFDINERGKMRHIKSVTMAERVVQRCLCDYALVPMLSRTFAHDNAASLKGKGYHFAIRRLCQHLHKHCREHGTEGFVLLYDFRKFFDNVSHELCKEILREGFTDGRIIALTEYFIDAFGGEGLGLGSQISQILALASANRLDHYIKDVCGIRGYGRYMDDGYVIHESKDKLHEILEGIKQVCAELKITLNEKKTQIVKLTHGFTFLKARIYLTESGKVIKKIPKESVTRERRKLKKLLPLCEKGKITLEDVSQSRQSWRAYADNFDAHKSARGIERLFNRLFAKPQVNREPVYA